MKIIIYITLIFSFFYCKPPISNEVLINSSRDTVGRDCLYLAKLFVLNNPKFAPDFYVIVEKDTFQLEVNQDENCGIFRYSGDEGYKEFKGFSEFYDLNNKKIKKDFVISFYVK